MEIRMSTTFRCGALCVAALVAALAPATAIAETGQESEEREPATYTVKRGDSLSKISARELWRVLWYLNRDTIDNPDRIEPGMVLRMPSEFSQVDLVVAERRTDSVRVLFAEEKDARFYLPRQQGVVPLTTGQSVMEFGTLEVLQGPVRLKLADDSEITLYSDTVLEFGGVMVREQGRTTRTLTLKSGRARFALIGRPDEAARLDVHTPAAVLSPRSREFDVAIAGKETFAGVFDGSLEVVSNAQSGSFSAGSGVRVPVTGSPMTRLVLPEAPQLAEPSGISGHQVRFAWQPAAGAEAYFIRIARDAAMTDIVFTGRVGPEGNFELELRNEGDYYWTVESLAGEHLHSKAPSPRRFQVRGSVVR